MEKIIKALIEAIESLINNEVDDGCVSEVNGQMTGHWSGTKEVMEKQLRRPLTPEEITCLSLGRNFGPTPVLNDGERMALFSHIKCEWEWMDWEELKRRLETF